MDQKIRTAVDTKLRAGGVFNYNAIEDALGEIYRIGDDVPTIDDNEMHDAVSELHAHYVNLSLVKPGE